VPALGSRDFESGGRSGDLADSAFSDEAQSRLNAWSKKSVGRAANFAAALFSLLPDSFGRLLV
jgi:hypothetical protein